jgi:hypothetical protein
MLLKVKPVGNSLISCRGEEITASPSMARNHRFKPPTLSPSFEAVKAPAANKVMGRTMASTVKILTYTAGDTIVTTHFFAIQKLSVGFGLRN